MNNQIEKAIIESFKTTISNLVKDGVWHSKEGLGIKVSSMSNRHLLFSHRFLVNKIDSLNDIDDFNFDDDIFKLSILAVEGINVFMREINKRHLSLLPSDTEIQLDFNESLKSGPDSEFAFKSKYLKDKSMSI